MSAILTHCETKVDKEILADCEIHMEVIYCVTQMPFTVYK